LLASLLGEHYMGNLGPRDIKQPEWFAIIEAAPVLHMSVEEINGLDPAARTYWVSRAIQVLNTKAEAKRLLDAVAKRESS
jgi:hypothetical protein